jgi:AraC family transcriptional regulator
MPYDGSLQIRDAGFARLNAGPCEPLPRYDHGLSINTGTPVWAIHRQAGRSRRYLRAPGGINFVPAGSVSHWVLDAPLTLVKLHMPQSLILGVTEDMDLDISRLELQTATQVQDAQIERLAWALATEADAGNPNGTLFNENLSLALSIALVRRFGHSLPAARIREGRFTPTQLKRITDYVESNLGQESLSVRHLATVAGTSLSHFKFLFRRSTGVSVHRFVVQRRVERAATLLRLGRSSITEIALESGFSHPTHMARWTRRLMGATPGDIRRQSNKT